MVGEAMPVVLQKTTAIEAHHTVALPYLWQALNGVRMIPTLGKSKSIQHPFAPPSLGARPLRKSHTGQFILSGMVMVQEGPF
jgi:hypothetical protein